jgi:ABC-type polysaccharide/polyol phosphate transport system ATPase subunit
MSTAIEFSHVSKHFRLERDKPRAFQDLFISLAQRRRNREAEEFWALKDVSFDVQRGETIGLIGSNGSGKSTSLKLITRIISPSAGTVSIHGRVTALLELGAGFHPELSGRDNVYLNGTILGLSRKEISKKIDAIIEFSELEDFIDVQVKNYSSGMYARLGFAVSVYLDPEILLIDEVLSVGDQSFQQKCNERMLKLRQQGITIAFVSHDLDSVSRLCSRAVWLDHGHVIMDDEAPKVTEAYYKHVLEKDSSDRNEGTAWAGNRLGSGEARITKIEFLGKEGTLRHVFLTNEPLTIRMYYKTFQRIELPVFGLAFYHAASGTHLSGPNNRFDNIKFPVISDQGYIDYHIDKIPFLPGDYLLSTSIYDWNDTHQYDFYHHCARFTIIPGGTNERYGLVSMNGSWDHIALSTKIDMAEAERTTGIM